ncbi:MAG: hypothetical protein KJ645_10665, partial [Planctomycetes bacterium]|nr:hypothetical protein [Planctomycetota bacterium]
DVVVVHPASVVGDAWEDTADLLWDDLDWHRQYVTECAALPWRSVMTPVVFAGDFLGRSLFNIPDQAEAARKEEEKAQAAKAQRAAFDAAFDDPNPLMRWVAFRQEMGRHSSFKTQVYYIERGLQDPEPFIRYDALRACEGLKDLSELFEELEALGESDENPILSHLARNLLLRAR